MLKITDPGVSVSAVRCGAVEVLDRGVRGGGWFLSPPDGEALARI